MASLPADPSTPPVSLTSGLARSFPRQAEEEEAGITGANTMKMQALAGGVATGQTSAPTKQQVNSAGAQLGSSGATQAAGAAEQAGQQMLGAGQAQLQGEGVKSQAAEAAYGLGAQKTAADNENRLAKLSQSTQQSLVSQQMQFQTNQIGQGTLNETQLMDWSVKNADSQQQLQDNMQTISLANERYLQMLQVGYAKTSQKLQEVEAGTIQDMSNADKAQLMQAAQYFKVAFMQQQAKIRDQQAMIGAAGQVAGTVGGAVVGGPQGAIAGGQIGAGVGSLASSQVAQ